MKHITLVFALLASLIASPALAQQFPNMPANTFLCRLDIPAQGGPGQACPFSAMSQILFGNTAPNIVMSGPATAPNAPASFRALVPADLIVGSGGGTANFLRADGTWSTPSGVGVLGTNNTWTGTNNFNGDTCFKDGRPWADVRCWGAVGDGVTNDTTAVQNAINAIAALGAGTVYLPPGSYCVNGGVSITSGVIHIEAASYAQLNTCGGNVTAVLLNSAFSSITRTTIVGPGLQAGAAPAGNALTLGSSCVSCTVTENLVNGGLANILIQAPDVYIENNVTGNAYGLGHVVMRLSGYLVRNKIDQNWPVSIPAAGLSPAARANTTGYANGTVVSLAGFYIQQGSGGACTSGGSPPTLQNYNVAITDGTCSWRLVAPTTHYGINYDTGTTQTFAWGNDTSGPFTAGIGITNSLAGASPQGINIDGHTVGQTITGGIIANNGNGLVVTNSTMANCLGANCVGVALQSGWLGDATISGNLFFTNPFGINVSAGTQLVVSSNKIYGSTTDAILIQANITDFNIIGNTVGTSAIWGANTAGIVVAAGTSNRYNIIGNLGTVTDSGTGAIKVIQTGATFNIGAVNANIRVVDSTTSFAFLDILGGASGVLGARFGQEGQGGGNNLIVGSAASDFVINMRDNKRIIIGTNNTAQVFISASGGLGVGTATDPGVGSIIVNKVLQTVATTVGGLPTCNAAARGARSFVTDANATFTAGIGAVVATGGANNVPVTCDGTNWRIGANDNIPELLRRKFA